MQPSEFGKKKISRMLVGKFTSEASPNGAGGSEGCSELPSGASRGQSPLLKFLRFQTLLDWLRIGPNWVVCFIVTVAPLVSKSNLYPVLQHFQSRVTMGRATLMYNETLPAYNVLKSSQ